MCIHMCYTYKCIHICNTWMEYHQPKSNKNICPFYTVFQVVEVLLVKICKTTASRLFISSCFNYIAFTSAS